MFLVDLAQLAEEVRSPIAVLCAVALRSPVAPSALQRCGRCGASRSPGAAACPRTRITSEVRRPLVHQQPPSLEQVRARIGRLDLVLDHVSQRRLDDLARMVRHARPPSLGTRIGSRVEQRRSRGAGASWASSTWRGSDVRLLRPIHARSPRRRHGVRSGSRPKRVSTPWRSREPPERAIVRDVRPSLLKSGAGCHTRPRHQHQLSRWPRITRRRAVSVEISSQRPVGPSSARHSWHSSRYYRRRQRRRPALDFEPPVEAAAQRAALKGQAVAAK